MRLLRATAALNYGFSAAWGGAAETGAAMHHCHVNATSRRHIDRVLAILERSRDAGNRVTVEAYPYGAGSTGIGAFFLAPDRLRTWGLEPSNIVMLASGERIADAARLREVRAIDPGAACIVEFLDEHDPADQMLLHQALAFPDAIVASDAMPVTTRSGVLDEHAWPLPSCANASAYGRHVRQNAAVNGARDRDVDMARSISAPFLLAVAGTR
jgi:hypothetical protein